ncbi:AAA family ATPase [Bradyrhizobium diazoefficiens]|uniref:AAA family ATPase n=1 Tax=Bradyrhizobium diazoefficiens TaxID=1355477 RepID=UPI003516C60A
MEMSFRQPNGSARAWTFVLGQNGVGKSSVLRAIALVSAGGEALAEIVGEPDLWIRLGRKEAIIELDYATSAGAARSAKLVFKRGAGVRGFLDNNKTQLELLDRAIAHADRNYFVVGYGVSRRNSSEALSSISSASFRNARAQNVATLFSSDAALISVQQWAMDLDYRRGAKGLDIVKTALNSIMPGVTLEGIDKKERQLRFSTSDGRLPLSSLSDGYQSMAAWCGDILYRITETFSDYSDPLKARGVLLVDEIDLHLHPLWQRQLVTFLSRTLPNFQIVTTTHSPLTAHEAGRNELFVLRRQTPKSPTKLFPYEGAPNELLLHQLIQSPVFGLSTLDSSHVGGLRNELRRLQNLPVAEEGSGGNVSSFVPPDEGPSGGSSSRRRRVDEIKAQLANVADWTSVPAYLRPTNELLATIQSELSASKGNGSGKPKRAVASRPKKATSAKRRRKKA